MLNLNENCNDPGTPARRAKYYSRTLPWTLAWSREMRMAAAHSVGETVT